MSMSALVSRPGRHLHATIPQQQPTRRTRSRQHGLSHGQQHTSRSHTSCTRAQSRRNYRDAEPEVRLDGEEEQRAQQPTTSQGFFSAVTGQAMSLFNFSAAKLTDTALMFAPPGTSVVVVERAVKFGIVLALLALVRSFLSVILTLGSVALAIYVATRVFGVQVSDGYSSSSSSQGGDARPQRDPRRGGRGGRGLQRRRDAKQEDVIDVWYGDEGESHGGY